MSRPWSAALVKLPKLHTSLVTPSSHLHQHPDLPQRQPRRRIRHFLFNTRRPCTSQVSSLLFSSPARLLQRQHRPSSSLNLLRSDLRPSPITMANHGPINGVKISGACSTSHSLYAKLRINAHLFELQRSMTRTRSSRSSPPMARPETKQKSPTPTAKSSATAHLALSSKPGSLVAQKTVATSPSRKSFRTSGSRSVRS